MLDKLFSFCLAKYYEEDIKSIFNCTDTTIAKMFNRDDFPAIMIGEHKVEKTALKKWLQERRI